MANAASASIANSDTASITTTLPLTQLDLGLGAPGTERRNLETLDRQAVRKVEGGYLRRHLEPDRPVSRNVRREPEADTEFLEGDADGATAGPALDARIGKLA